MKNRVKVGDIEIGVVANPDPAKTNWLVTRYRARTNEYLSKQEAPTREQAQYLFTQVVGQEQLRQKKKAAEEAEMLQHASFVTDAGLAEVGLYSDHPFYARF